MLPLLQAQVADAYEKALAVGQCSSMREPQVVIVSERPSTSGVVITWYGHFRIVHYAQSGSDWGDHVVLVKETTFDADWRIASERTLGERTLNVPERDENTYDDDEEARSVASAIIGK
jgi:hypothetical protein